MIDLLLVEDLTKLFAICFFIGFGLSLSGVLIATLFHFAKDILFNSV